MKINYRFTFYNGLTTLIGTFKLKSTKQFVYLNLILLLGLVAFSTRIRADSNPTVYESFPLTPSISSDPTKAQQPIQTPTLTPDNPKNKGFEIPEETVKPAPQAKSGNQIQLTQVEFEGNTVFASTQLTTVVADYLNRPILASDIEAMRLKVSQYYSDHGYINSGAVLTTQSLSDGVLHLKIIEGRLTEVKQSGQEWLNEAYLRDRLIVGSGNPLNVDNLKDTYRRLLTDPLFQQLNGRLLPGIQPGEALLDVQVKRNRSYQLYAGADDYSTASVGSYAGRMGGTIDNLFTVGEHIDAQFIANGGALGYNTGISIPLNGYDTRATFRYSSTNSNIIEAPFNILDITSHITGIDGGLSHPIYNTFADKLILAINFVVRESQTQSFNSCNEGSIYTGVAGLEGCKTNVTVLRMGQRYTHRGDGNSVVFYSTFNAGLNALGATTTQSGGQSGQFFSWLGQSNFSQQLLENGTLLVLKANIQLADTPLLPLERYSIGGVNTVRGYRENSYIRDNGFNTNLEIKYPLYGGANGEKQSLFLVPFLDYGGGWNNSANNAASASSSATKTNYLFSNGLGFNWQYQHVTTDFYWAHAWIPVTPAVSGHSIQDDGIHFRVNFTAF